METGWKLDTSENRDGPIRSHRQNIREPSQWLAPLFPCWRQHSSRSRLMRPQTPSHADSREAPSTTLTEVADRTTNRSIPAKNKAAILAILLSTWGSWNWENNAPRRLERNKNKQDRGTVLINESLEHDHLYQKHAALNSGKVLRNAVELIRRAEVYSKHVKIWKQFLELLSKCCFYMEAEVRNSSLCVSGTAHQIMAACHLLAPQNTRPVVSERAINYVQK